MSFLFKHSPFSFFLESEKLVLVNALIDNSFSSCFDISFYTSFFIGNKNNEFYWNVCPNAPSSTVFFFFRGISFSISWQNFQGWLLSQKSRIVFFHPLTACCGGRVNVNIFQKKKLQTLSFSVLARRFLLWMTASPNKKIVGSVCYWKIILLKHCSCVHLVEKVFDNWLVMLPSEQIF